MPPDHPMPRPEAPDMMEHGAPIDGKPQQLDRRMYVQLQLFTDVEDTDELVAAAREHCSSGMVIYGDFNDPLGIGVVSVAEDPALLSGDLRRLVRESAFADLTPVPEFTMVGRTYGSGREQNLEEWLLRQVPQRLADPRMPWAIWYPLRRKPAFYQLERRDSGRILAEHGLLGRTYGEAGLAQDIRLKCFGLDRDDNEFLIGLVGPDLHPLSRLVEDMRQTKQTSEWLESLGPFFVGHRIAAINLP